MNQRGTNKLSLRDSDDVDTKNCYQKLFSKNSSPQGENLRLSYDPIYR